MRISTSWTQQLSVNTMLDQQAKLSNLQMQLSTQKKILTPSDNPAGAARVIDLNQGIQQTEQYQSNINSARQRLTIEDGVLQGSVDILDRIRELGLQGLNATYSPEDRKIIATEMLELKDELLGLANTRNANNEYLFSGYKSDVQSFTKNALTGGYDYGGDLNQRNIQISTNQQVADGNPGVDVFGTPTGLGPAALVAGSIDNVFEAIDKFATNFSSTPNVIDPASLDDISKALNRISTIQSSVGVRLNTLDRLDSFHTDGVLSLKTMLSETEDVDIADAISKFTLQKNSLDAAQQAFGTVKNLSLFNYLR
ncbi:MAG: flagellar hook-associated protein FlgL [Methylococcaceae bacterium]|nr:flagellar hook-associated protein FlgL [Methylococcaceae bacterium]